MKKLIPTLLGIQSGEGVRASLMFLYAMFLLSAYLILKPVRNSLFLEKFGPQELVYMYMIIAVFAAVIISAYTKVGARLGLKKYITVTTLFLVTNLVAFWWLISQEYNWLVYVFYVWVSIFGAITTSQFWLLANHIFDAREAKRLFPFIGAGAITGGIIGSKLTGLLAETLGTEALLWICVGFLALIQTLLLLVWPLRAKDSLRGSARKRMKDADTRGMWPLVFRDKYLRLLTGCIALTVMVSTFVDFQFNWVVSETFEDKDARTAFFGDFFFYLSLLSLGMQLILSSRILRKFGVGAAILILPVGLLLGSAAIFTYPRLIWSAVLVKISDGSFRYSINKAGFELLYLPVASAIKNRVKGLMDVVGDRFARGIGGALLFVCTAVLSFEIGEISILSGALILAWIFLVIRLRKEYSNSFRNALERRTIDIDQVRASLRESASLESLILSLRSKSPRQILFTLEFSSGITDDRLKEPLTELLAHHRNDVRAEALRQLAGFSDPALADVICPLAHDDDPTVRLEAIRYICGSIEPEGERGAKQLLQSDNLEFKASLYRCLLEEGETQQTPLRPDEIDEILADNTPKMAPVRRELASALAFAGPDNPLSAKFDRFLSDTDPVVLRRSIASAAHVKRRDLAPRLLELLSRSELRAAVIKALVEYGSVILGAMRDALVDPEKDFATRARLPRVIALIGGSEAAQTLTQQLALPDLSLRYNVIKALGTLRNRDSGVRFDEDFLREQLKNEAYESYIISAHLRALRSENKPGGAVTFLIRSLEDRRRIRLEQLFRLAGLIYPQDDMIRAFHGVISGSPGLRAGAIEFLDTMWTRPDKEMFFGMFESRGDALMSARRLLGIPSFKKEESIANLLDSSDVWLAACAANVAREEKLTAHREKLSALAQSQNQTLSETADRALSAIAP